MATPGDTIAPERPATRPRYVRPRRWPRRLLIGGNLAVASIVLATGLGYLYVKLRLGEINSVNIPGLTPATSGPNNILIVGSDSRANLTDPNANNAFGGSAATAGQRSDVTMVLHIDPNSKQASVLSIPRDLYVPIAGTNRSDRINSSFGNGPQQLIQTIQSDLGIPIHHYVSMNFDGFQGLVNAVGGIDVNFPDPAKDAFSGLNITKTGCQHLDGAAALSLARSRDYQYLADGSWHFDGNGDLSRIQRQHTFIRILMGKAISAGIHNPITANSIIGSAVHDVTIDNKLSTNDILGLVMQFRSLSPNNLPTYTLPTTPAVIGGADVLRLDQPAGTQTVQQFLNPAKPPSATTTPAPPPVAPSSVRVQVLNGSGSAGQASQAASQLRSAGFVVAGTGNDAGTRMATSEVLYAPGKQQAAQFLQGRVGGGASIQQDPALQGADVALVTGTSFTGITQAAAPAPAAPAPAPAPAVLPPYDPRAC
ncbi:MAG TPA: LCP family protein [Acidimicrobiales bacterium]